ncbi:MAG TPA: GxxExxY protein [Planctomycetota bacterium]|jgi:GxxExxY protein
MVPTATLNGLSHLIIGCAIEVHRRLGPGLLESIYVDALCIELERAGLSYERQKDVPIIYRDRKLGAPLKLDLIVAGKVIIEVKSVSELAPVHEAQLLSYLRLTGIDLGLLINFNVAVLKSGVRRKMRQFVLPEKEELPKENSEVAP